MILPNVAVTQWNRHLLVLVADPSAHMTLHAQLSYPKSECEDKSPKREWIHCSDHVDRFVVSDMKLRKSNA